MTTFHDGPPPQSRRAARESERAALNTSQNVDYGAFVEPSTADQGEQAAPVADAAATADSAVRPVPGGRRAQRDEGGPDAESVSHVTQIPSYDGPSFSRTTPESSAPAKDDAPPREDAQYRLRDYSPEGRRAAQPQSSQAAELDYRTQAAPAPAAWQPPVDVSPSVPAFREPEPAAPSAEPAAQPMTRRELRAMQQQAEAAAAAAELVEPPAASASATALSNAIAEFEALTRLEHVQTGAIPVAPPVVAPVAPVAPAAPADFAPAAPAPLVDPFAGLGPAPSASQRVELPPPPSDWNTVEAPPAATAEPSSVPDAAEPAAFPFSLQSSTATPPPLIEPAAPEPATPEVDQLPAWARETAPWSPADEQQVDENAGDIAHDAPIAESDTSFDDSSFDEPHVVRESYTPPAGHWSRQAELDDDLPIESTLSREVGASNISTTTSALILPSIPQSDFSGLINGTGEILITGTIELPSSLGSMGADARHFDNPDVDHMFDAFDKELVSNDSQPVRAIRAVSTHTASRGVIQINTKPQRNNRLILAGLVIAGVLVVGAVGLLVFYVINHP